MQKLINEILEEGGNKFIRKEQLKVLLDGGCEEIFCYSDEGEYAGYTNYQLKTPCGRTIMVRV